MSDDVPRKAAPKMGRRARKDPPAQPAPSGSAGGVPTPSGPPPSGPPPGPPRAAVPRAPGGGSGGGGGSGPPTDGPPAPPPKVSSGWGLEEGGSENNGPRMNPTASDNVPTGDGSGRRKFGRRGAGGGGGGGGGDGEGRKASQRSARQDDDSGSDGIPEIPDLEDQEEEDEEDDIIKQVADAPVTRANQVQTLSELDHATKGAVPTARQLDVDISLLTSQLAPPGQLEEDNSLWNYEALFGEVSAALNKYNDEKEEASNAAKTNAAKKEATVGVA